MDGGLVRHPLWQGDPHRGQLAVESPGQGPPPQSLPITERRPPDSSFPSATGIPKKEVQTEMKEELKVKEKEELEVEKKNELKK